MNNWRDKLFIAMFALCVMTAYNGIKTAYHAQEAHKHSHDAACAAGHTATCRYSDHKDH